MPEQQLSAPGEIVRRHDPDRFFTALFAPPRHRETLFTLYAFNHELARASEVTREPFAALIRLQWWREVVEGARRRHEVAGPLGEAIDSGRLAAADLAGLVDAREAETETMPDLAAFLDYTEGTAGGVMVAAARALGMEGAEALRRAGSAYGISGIIRAAGPRTRTVLPADGPGPEALRTLALARLNETPRIPRPAMAAALPLVLARRRLRRPEGQKPWRPGSGRVAVILAAIMGRV